MKYGITENHKFVLIDEDLQRLKNTLLFMPQYRVEQIAEYEDGDVEQGHDRNWYEKGYAPQRPLEEAKAAKLAELKTAFQNTRETAHCMCALGFEIDANEEANTNIVGLISVMKEGETTMFRAYDNSFHEVSKEDLITMRNNIIKNSQFLYQMKWEMENRINNAVSGEELASLVWNY